MFELNETMLAELESILHVVVQDGGTIRDAIVAMFRAVKAERQLCKEVASRLILRAACEYYETTISKLILPSRLRCYTSRRYGVMVALRISGYSLPEIARELGYRDHTVVLHGLKEAEIYDDIRVAGLAIFDLAGRPQHFAIRTNEFSLKTSS